MKYVPLRILLLLCAPVLASCDNGESQVGGQAGGGTGGSGSAAGSASAGASPEGGTAGSAASANQGGSSGSSVGGAAGSQSSAGSSGSSPGSSGSGDEAGNAGESGASGASGAGMGGATFACGSLSCQRGAEVCRRQLPALPGGAEQRTCDPLPSACSAQDCSCYCDPGATPPCQTDAFCTCSAAGGGIELVCAGA